MANRFTDSRKWDDPWFRKLSPKYKAFWIFLLDKCDHAGIWKVDFESATFHIGEEITEEEALPILDGRVYPYKGKWFLPKFIFFQYGLLSENNRVHVSVSEILEKEGLFKVYERSIEGCKDKYKDKDKDEKITPNYNINISNEERQSLIDTYGSTQTNEYIERLKDYAAQFPAKFKKYASHYATIRNWMRKDGLKKLPPKQPVVYEKLDPAERDKVAALIRQTKNSMVNAIAGERKRGVRDI